MKKYIFKFLRNWLHLHNLPIVCKINQTNASYEFIQEADGKLKDRVIANQIQKVGRSGIINKL